jgi:MFS family permease
MYGLDWIEQLKLRTRTRPIAGQIGQVNPVVWKLGFTSFLTDISAEMVNSALPGYLVVFMHMSPLQYGAIDGIYNGFAVALLSLAAGLLADRTKRPKHISAAGYAVSAICKLLFLAAGGAWSWILAIVWLDRTGKGIRTAPRDAIISLNTPPPLLATSFAVHRALDAGGSLLGPLVTFTLLWQLPTGYNEVWITSFVFAALGVAVLWLLVPNPQLHFQSPHLRISLRSAVNLLFTRRFGSLAGCGLLLSTVSISDGFIYLLLRDKGGISANFFPLFYVVTASFYMLFSIPAGLSADRYGRLPVLLAGYGVLGLIYLMLILLPDLGVLALGGCLCLFGVFYAATEGVLTAMASAVIPPELRTSGIAIVATLVGIGKLISSVLFGWMWETYGALPSTFAFGVTLAIALPVAGFWLRVCRNG